MTLPGSVLVISPSPVVRVIINVGSPTVLGCEAGLSFIGRVQAAIDKLAKKINVVLTVAETILLQHIPHRRQ